MRLRVMIPAQLLLGMYTGSMLLLNVKLNEITSRDGGQNQGYDRQQDWQEPHHNNRGRRGGRGRGRGRGHGNNDWEDRRNYRDNNRTSEDEFGRVQRGGD